MDCAGGADSLLEERRRILAEPLEGTGASLRSRLHRLQRLPAVSAYDADRCTEMLVQAGLSPLEALRSATARPAEFSGLAEEMVTVGEGRLADLVLLSADPLEDITNTQTIQAVVSKGELLTSEELDALVR